MASWVPEQDGIAVPLENRDHALPTGAIGERAVEENDRWLGGRSIRRRNTAHRHPSPVATAIRYTPTPTTTAPMNRATRTPAGAKRSAVMAAATTAITRRSM